ncbi:MAG: hypothetical protein M1817_001894 [Caeruleum heppii]|nr:MAG: hypothetical protein M1817_001894 [Caeruleum heppii]
MSTIFNVQADVIGGYQTSSEIIKSVLNVGLSDDVHPVVMTYLDHLGSWLGASTRSMETVRAAVCIHGSAPLRKLGLMVGVKPVDTARLLADSSGGIAWLTWEAALLECCSQEDVAYFVQEAGRLTGPKSVVVPHTRELIAAMVATAPRLGTVSFPEHFAKTCGAMRQTLFAITETCPLGVAETPALSDVVELLVRIAEAQKRDQCVSVRGQQSIGWLAATLTWVYGEAVEVRAAGATVLEAETRSSSKGFPPLICVELCSEEISGLILEYPIDQTEIVTTLTTQIQKNSLASFGPQRSRAEQYFTNWLACTSPVSLTATGPLSQAAAQLTCGLLRTIHVTNEGGDSGLRAETSGNGRQLVNVLRLPGSYSDVRRIREFFAICDEPVAHDQPTSQLQQILVQSGPENNATPKVIEGGSTTALAFLARVPSLREVWGRMVREMLKIGIRGSNECCCVLPGSGPEAWLPSAHESHCGVHQAASLGLELVAACICNLFIEGPTSPRLHMFSKAPLRWAISKAIEQSVLTGSALISGADLIKSILVLAGYEASYGYGPLIVSSGGQVLVLAALHEMSFSPVSVGRIMAFPGAILHRGQYYERLVTGSCRRAGGDILRELSGSKGKHDSAEEEMRTIQPSDEGAANTIDIVVRETSNDLQLVVRSRQDNGLIKEHDLWHCITAGLTATVLGDCSHTLTQGYTLRSNETVTLVGTGTNLGSRTLHGNLTVALVHGKDLDRLLACGVGVNMVIQTEGCLRCAISACRQLGYSYVVDGTIPRAIT